MDVIARKTDLTLALLLVAACCLTSCTRQVGQEQRVLQSVLDHLVESGMLGRDGEGLVVLGDSLGVDPFELRVPAIDANRDTCLTAHYPSDELIADYLAKNRQWQTLQPAAREYALPLPYQFLHREEFEGILQDGGWSLYKRSFPGALGYLEFSSAGFDPAGDTALVYVARYPENGILLVLAKDRDRWRVVDDCLLWTSS